MVMYGRLWKSECWLCTGRTQPKVGQIGAIERGRRHSEGSRLVGLVGFRGSWSLKAAPKFGPSAAQRSWAASPDWWVWWVLWGREASRPRRDFGPSAAQRSWDAPPAWWVWWVLWGRGASRPRRDLGPSAGQRLWDAPPDWWVWWVSWGRGALRTRRDLGPSAAQRPWAATPAWWVWWVLWGRGASRPRRDLGPSAGQRLWAVPPHWWVWWVIWGHGALRPRRNSGPSAGLTSFERSDGGSSDRPYRCRRRDTRRVVVHRPVVLSSRVRGGTSVLSWGHIHESDVLGGFKPIAL